MVATWLQHLLYLYYIIGKTIKALIHKNIEAFLFVTVTTETILKQSDHLSYLVIMSQVP